MPNDSKTTRPCAGCQKPTGLEDGVLLHDRRFGDVPFCCQECCDTQGCRVWQEFETRSAESV